MQATINIDGAIGIDFWDTGESVTLKGITAQFEEQKTDDTDGVLVVINSPGGAVNEGYAIYDYLRGLSKSGVKVTTRVTGIAASMGSIIMLAGDVREVTEFGEVMIHNPWTETGGDAADLRKQADHLERLENKSAKLYADVAGLEIEDIKEMMRVETWLSAEEAVAMGFIHSIVKDTVRAQHAKQVLMLVSKLEKTKSQNLKAVAFYDKNNDMSSKKLSVVERIKQQAKVKMGLITMATYTLAGGEMIETDAEGEIATGQTVTMNGEPVADGEHTLEDGRVIVTEGSVITEVRDAAEALTEEGVQALLDETLAEVAEAHEAEMSELKAANEKLSQELMSLKAKMQTSGKPYQRQSTVKTRANVATGAVGATGGASQLIEEKAQAIKDKRNK